MNTYQIELANKIVNGRCLGNLYVVTMRPTGKSIIVQAFSTREQAQEWITSRAVA